jgi:deazaflavin-dependent oxidoreductase (nitroreductase family)
MLDAPTEERLRHGFRRYFNPFMVTMWRLGLGPWVNAWPHVGGRIMVVAHTGRKTGLQRRTPVNYAQVDGELYAVAGFGERSDWYRNLRAHPEAELWLPDGRWRAVAEDISSDPRRLKLVREVLIASGFAARAVGLDPQRASDAELARLTAKYPLLHFRRSALVAGPGGPGDLIWAWPLAALILLRLLAAGRRRKMKTIQTHRKVLLRHG